MGEISLSRMEETPNIDEVVSGFHMLESPRVSKLAGAGLATNLIQIIGDTVEVPAEQQVTVGREEGQEMVIEECRPVVACVGSVYGEGGEVIVLEGEVDGEETATGGKGAWLKVGWGRGGFEQDGDSAAGGEMMVPKGDA